MRGVAVPRHGLTLLRQYRCAGRKYRVRKWPLFAPRVLRNLKAWFAGYGRNLPWRDPRVSPFGKLVAELLLRQTSARHVAHVWQHLMDRYPSAQALACANGNDLERLIAPLGLAHQRTEALQRAAQHLVDHYQGRVPASEAELLGIPHVGPYAANAIRCFGYAIAAPVVDVNILRIMDRCFGVQTRTRNPHREPHVWKRALALLPEEDVATYQYALLDLAALVCRPRNPRCDTCPVAANCQFHARTAPPS